MQKCHATFQTRRWPLYAAYRHFFPAAILFLDATGPSRCATHVRHEAWRLRGGGPRCGMHYWNVCRRSAARLHWCVVVSFGLHHHLPHHRQRRHLLSAVMNDAITEISFCSSIQLLIADVGSLLLLRSVFHQLDYRQRMYTRSPLPRSLRFNFIVVCDMRVQRY